MALGKYLGGILGIIGAIIGGVLGAAGGFGFGAPAGAMWGFSIGAMIGGISSQLFWPEKADINAPPPPQPHETRLQFSSWGMAIPIQYDSGRMAGNVIYMSDIKETIKRHKDRLNGVRYYEMTKTYTATFAIAFCEPIENVGRIWINNKVFADYRNPLSPNYPVGDGDMAYANWQTTIARSAIYFSIHLGSETQAADASISALLTAAEVPAYRGVTYIVFKDFPVGEFSGVPTIEIESNPVPHGNLIIYQNPTLSLMVGLTGEVASQVTFPSPHEGGYFGSMNAVTPGGNLAKLWTAYIGGVWVYRVYVFVGLSNTISYYFIVSDNVGSFQCEPITGRFIIGSYYPRGTFYIYEPDGTFVTSWVDSTGDLPPYNHGAPEIIAFLVNSDEPNQPGNIVVLYRNAYLVYYQGYDILYVYPSYLGGTRLYPPAGGNYKVGPITHDDADPTNEPYSGVWYAPARLTSDYIWGIHYNLQGYYKFRMSDLIDLTPTNVTRVQLPASAYHLLSPPHDTDPQPTTGMVMTNGFEG
jgi:hypothetical protein